MSVRLKYMNKVWVNIYKFWVKKWNKINSFKNKISSIITKATYLLSYDLKNTSIVILIFLPVCSKIIPIEWWRCYVEYGKTKYRILHRKTQL